MSSQLFKCESCDAGFLYKEHLKMHISPEGLCHSPSSPKENLKDHESNQHKETNPFSIICSVKLPSKANSKRQIVYDHEKKKMTKIDTFDCEVEAKEQSKSQIAVRQKILVLSSLQSKIYNTLKNSIA